MSVVHLRYVKTITLQLQCCDLVHELVSALIEETFLWWDSDHEWWPVSDQQAARCHLAWIVWIRCRSTNGDGGRILGSACLRDWGEYLTFHTPMATCIRRFTLVLLLQDRPVSSASNKLVSVSITLWHRDDINDLENPTCVTAARYSCGLLNAMQWHLLQQNS